MNKKNSLTVNSLSHIVSGLNNIDTKSGSKVVDNSQHVGESTQNMVKPLEVKPDNKAARNDARFQAAKKQQFFDEEDTPAEELSEADDVIVDKYIEEILDNAIWE